MSRQPRTPPPSPQPPSSPPASVPSVPPAPGDPLPTPDRVLQELVRIAFADLAGIVTVRGGEVVVTNSADLTADQRAALAEVSATTTQHGGTVKVKLHDKLRALELLGRHLGLFSERHTDSGAAGAALRALLAQIPTAAVQERINALHAAALAALAAKEISVLPAALAVSPLIANTPPTTSTPAVPSRPIPSTPTRKQVRP